MLLAFSTTVAAFEPNLVIFRPLATAELDLSWGMIVDIYLLLFFDEAITC
jgi:hypothetical protein